MNVEQKYQKWKNSPLPDYLKKQLLSMNQEEIYDAFYTNLEFGTAGIRGILGPGSNRLNIYVVRKATIGFSKYLLENVKDASTRGVVVSHDNRNHSREFTLEIAKVFSSYGIKVYIFDDLRPTPELSFAVRKLNAVGGVMITASHNPKEYNGYKVYDEEGCQLTPTKIKPLLDIISSLGEEIDLTYGDSDKPGEIVTLNSDVDQDYVNHVLSIQINPELEKDHFKIVFSPQHGTSLERAREIFEKLGYDVTYVKEQCTHDPNFSNTASPNPEMKEAFELSLLYAKKVDADLILCTDPDGDRIGIAFKDKNDEYQLYSGNKTGALLINYILGQKRQKGLLKNNSVIFDTVVTSSLGQKIAKYYGVETESVLTGFKFIGEKIHQYEISKEKNFEFGYEESYGCLIAPFVRDKDSLQALVMICEMTNFYLKQGKTLDVVLDNLMKIVGYHEDKLFSIYFDGPNGKEKMESIMAKLKEYPLKKILNSKLVKYEDYSSSKVYSLDKKELGSINLPKTNLLKFYFEDGSTIAIRPSGTEPKCKFYFGAVSQNKKENEGKNDLMFEELKKELGI
ncbi:MAG: phospho-sugar mutase [Bacilli bacterium]|nr:phospho-sugar mutase [Bacillales bacterium]MDY2574992.1 phospho-sugar mutase [Bacilli bacterium]